MTYLAKRARRILAGTRVDSIGVRIFPGYISFEENRRPDWWKSDLAPETWGTVLGVHENDPDTRVGSIVVTELGLGILGEGNAVTWLPYSDVAGWDQLSKDPISRSLNVRSKSGEKIELLFSRGGAFGFVRFLSNAMRERARAAAHTNGSSSAVARPS